jgi:hypothetical protein
VIKGLETSIIGRFCQIQCLLLLILQRREGGQMRPFIYEREPQTYKSDETPKKYKEHAGRDRHLPHHPRMNLRSRWLSFWENGAWLIDGRMTVARRKTLTRGRLAPSRKRRSEDPSNNTHDPKGRAVRTVYISQSLTPKTGFNVSSIELLPSSVYYEWWLRRHQFARRSNTCQRRHQ